MVHSLKRCQSSWIITLNRLCSGQTYIKDSGDFLKKIRNLVSLPENDILVTADVAGLYPSIPQEAGLQTLEEALENRNHKQISTEKLMKMAKFVLKNNFF